MVALQERKTGGKSMPKKNSREIVSIEKAARHLAPVCLAIALQHRQTTGELQSHLKTSLKWLLRDAERYVRPRASAKAPARAKAMGIENLQDIPWRSQRLKLNDPERKIFQWEHVTQVADLADSILALQPPTLEEIETIVRTIVIAWILKDEDRNLPRGPRSDPLSVYRSAGIDLQD
jgi:hypothetical protein